MNPEAIKRAAERVASVSDHFVLHDRYGPLESQFKSMLDRRLTDLSRGRVSEARGLALSAASGAGKTASILFLLKRARGWLAESDHPDAAIISFRVPSPATLKFVGQTLLRALGFQISSERQAWYIWDLVRHHLKERKVLFVHLDEAQDLSARGTRHERDAVASMLKSLMTDEDWPVGIILTGTTELEGILNHDPQLARRMKAVLFDPLSSVAHAEDVVALVASYCRRGGLTAAEDVSTLQLGERLIHAAGNQFGLVIELTLAAMEQAYLIDDSHLRLLHFSRAFAQRSACDDAFNPFIIPDYHRIDARRVFGRGMVR